MSKKILLGIGALVVVGMLYLGLTSRPASAPVQLPVSDQSAELGAGSGGNITQQQDRYTNGIGIGPNYITFSRSGSVNAGSNSGSWRNTTGRTVYIDLAAVTTTGTASSSSLVYSYASTTLPSTTYDFATPASANRMMINAFALATSSAATTTSSIEKAPAGKVIAIPDGSYFIVLLKQDTTNANVACAAAGLCETATSTNRGFNLNWYFRGYYLP